MTDRELEQRLRAWYAAEVGESETAPEDLREALAAIPLTTPTPLRPVNRRRGFTLLAIAAVLVVGGAVAAGAGLLRFNTVKPPVPSTALLTTPPPSEAPVDTPAPTLLDVRPGGLIAFVRSVAKPEGKCSSRFAPNCPTPRIWVVNVDGSGAHELQAGTGWQALLGWSPDGTRLLYTDEGKLYVANADGSQPRPVDTGCVGTCYGDSQVSLSSDGRQIVFVRQSLDADGYVGPAAIVTMDLEGGQVAALNPTSPSGGIGPRWSPDGTRIVFAVPGDKDTNGPYPPRPAAIWMVDRDGENLRQVSPATLDAVEPDWSPDGQRIVFVSPLPVAVDNIASWNAGDVYTMRPDGSDVRRLTTDGAAKTPRWTPDGRILFTRVVSSAAVGSEGWWTMDADGTDVARLVTADAIGVKPEEVGATDPVWQPLGGPAVVPVPWAPVTQTAVGPPAPTPSPTQTPELGRGFSWTGALAMTEDGPLTATATLLADGWVLITGGCSTKAQLYDPATGTFHSTGDMTVVRGGQAATLLRDGRVLFTGGYNCAKAGEDGVWASAELYDPTTGTFGPTGSMRTPREFHTATLLADGRVLIAGGYTANRPATGSAITLAAYPVAESAASVLKSAELYDPAAGTFSKTGPMSAIRDNHTATLLNDGRVLVVGGGGEGYASSTSADVYDPATGTFSKTGSMKTGRWLHTATLLDDGRVLMVGGRSPKDSVYKSAETYDPRSGKFTSAGAMAEGRQQHTATRLPDGRVLITAGYWSDGQRWRVLSSAEMFDPRTGDFTPIGSIGTPREGHSALLLNDGRVLIVGGSDIGRDGGYGVSSAVLYQP